MPAGQKFPIHTDSYAYFVVLQRLNAEVVLDLTLYLRIVLGLIGRRD